MYRIQGVDQEFLDGLERVERKVLKEGMDCPICGNDFVDGEATVLQSWWDRNG